MTAKPAPKPGKMILLKDPDLTVKIRVERFPFDRIQAMTERYHALNSQDNPLLGSTPSSNFSCADGQLDQWDVRGPTISPGTPRGQRFKKGGPAGVRRTGSPPTLKIDPDGSYQGVQLPSYVFSTRRQTDQMVRQLLELLPKETRDQVVFLNADRVVQNPEQALRELNDPQKRSVVIFGSFMGMGNNDTFRKAQNPPPPTDPKQPRTEPSKIPAYQAAQHKGELEALERCIDLVMDQEPKRTNNNLEISDLFFALGDTDANEQHAVVMEHFNRLYKAMAVLLAGQDKKRNEERDDKKLTRLLQKTLGFGADEVGAVTIARQITVTGKKRVTAFVWFDRPGARQHYEMDETAESLAETCLRLLDVVRVTDPRQADLHVLVFADPGRAYSRGEVERVLRRKESERKPPESPTFDGAGEVSKAVVIDVRTSNGALNSSLVPPAQALAYSSWGTFVNSFAQGVAQAVVLHAHRARASSEEDRKRSEEARKDLLVQAVAHDAFIIGGEGGISIATELNHLVPWKSQRYVLDPNHLHELCARITAHVKTRLAEHFEAGELPDITGIRTQLNRTFEMVPLTAGEIGKITGM